MTTYLLSELHKLDYIHYQDNKITLISREQADDIQFKNIQQRQRNLAKFESYPPIICTIVPIPHHLLAIRDHHETTTNHTNHGANSTSRKTSDTQTCFRASHSRKLKKRRNRRRAPSLMKKPKYTRDEADAIILKDQQETRACLNCDQPGYKSRQCPSLTCTFCKAAWPSIDTPGRHLFVNCPIRNIPIKDQYSFMQVR
jgi:hypothetical protein